MGTRERTHLSRTLLMLCAGGLLAGSIGCGASQDSDRTNAFDDAPAQEQRAAVVPHALSDTTSDPDDDAPEHEREAPEPPRDESEADDVQDRLEAAIEAASKGDRRGAQRDLKALADDEEFGAYALYNLGVI